jgi:hypothetical protein
MFRLVLVRATISAHAVSANANANANASPLRETWAVHGEREAQRQWCFRYAAELGIAGVPGDQAIRGG